MEQYNIHYVEGFLNAKHIKTRGDDGLWLPFDAIIHKYVSCWGCANDHDREILEKVLIGEAVSTDC